MRAAAPVSDDFLAAASALIGRRTGLAFAGPRAQDLRAALVRAARNGDASHPDAWLLGVERDPARLDDLIADITIGETYFFREPEQYAILQEEILPRLAQVRAGADEGLRCWSAGCSSGEEPYTLAILLRRMGLHARAHLVGTDLSRAALVRARQGSYSAWSLRGVAPELVDEYFHRTGRRFVLADSIRQAVDFRYLNLAEDSYPSLASGIAGMDLIVCRNVLIYFDRETIIRVAARLLDALAPHGWLLLGSSDPMLGDLVPCEVVMTSAGMMYRRAGQTAPRVRWHRPASRVAPPRELVEPLPVAAPAAPFTPAPPPEAVHPLPPAPAPTLAEAAGRYATRDYRAAAEMASELARTSGSGADEWILWIRALANQGALHDASRACTAALERHPAIPELHYLEAMLLGEAGHADAARAAARRALYLDRTFVMAHLALAVTLTRQGEAGAARQALRAGERLLAALPPESIVPASDGEAAGRLLAMARAQAELLAGQAG